jgi:cadmium resistance protein CadD (predicted permease)
MGSGGRRIKILIGSMVAFVIVLTLCIIALRALPYSPWRNVLALVPVFPVIGVGASVARALGEMDELQKRIQLEALAFSLANTALLTFSLGLLQLSAPTYINLTWVLPIAAAFWGLGLFIAARRYQ